MRSFCSFLTFASLGMAVYSIILATLDILIYKNVKLFTEKPTSAPIFTNSDIPIPMMFALTSVVYASKTSKTIEVTTNILMDMSK